MAIFDTDIIIWIQRGNVRAAQLVENTPDRAISIQTYMELLQNAKNKQQHAIIKAFLRSNYFDRLPLSENIGYRASIYVEEYGLSGGIRAGDAIIAATAVENSLPLYTSNAKQFKAVKELDLKVFRP